MPRRNLGGGAGREASASAKPVALRDHNNYSVLLGVFHNAGYHQTVTLAQVFWIRDAQGQPARFYAVADRDLQIVKDFAGFGDDIKSLRKRLRRKEYRLSMDTRFTEVLAACAEPRTDSRDPKDAAGTWITSEMRMAYTQLHLRGFAHSVEAWYEDTLVGGLYGVSLGRMFFGESMFSRRNDASKVALVGLAAQLQAWEFTLIDCQMLNPHLERLGVYEIPRLEFANQLDANARAETRLGPWKFDVELP